MLGSVLEGQVFPRSIKSLVFSSDPKMLCLGLIQSLFEGSMYSFVLEWTPALTPGKFSPSLTILFILSQKRNYINPVSNVKRQQLHHKTGVFYTVNVIPSLHPQPKFILNKLVKLHVIQCTLYSC